MAKLKCLPSKFMGNESCLIAVTGSALIERRLLKLVGQMAKESNAQNRQQLF